MGEGARGYNQDGFYDDLLRFFERMVTEGFNKASNAGLIHVAATIDELLDQIEEAPAAAEAKWFDTQ